MSELIDIVVKPDILGGKRASIKGCVSMKYLRRITLPSTGNRQMQSFSFAYEITERTTNSIIIPVIVSGGGYIVYGGSLPSYRVNTISGVTVTGSVVAVDVFSNAWDGEAIPNSGLVDVYEILTPSTQSSGNYGISIPDGVNWPFIF